MADNLALYLFLQGTNFRAYDYLGAHKVGDGECVFRVWAPGADRVYLTGDFNGWQADTPMENIGGVWELTLKNEAFCDGERYKYIVERDGERRFKADPYAFYSETLANTASKLFDISGFKWSDGSFLKDRKKRFGCLENGEMPAQPMNIYEVHLGSWQRDENGGYLNYRELADRLCPYVKQMGYTHIELMPVAEHPFDGSWGYQVCGYYAPTSRFGTPHDFMYFVNKMHRSGIGVIMDWVPAHFPKDAHGLYEFDGAPLYEYQGEDRREHKEWGTRCFDVARNEVACFLISNALYWIEQYHIDGLRVDAVSSMLYLDYGRKAGEWNPNEDGSNFNMQSIHFFKRLNYEVKKRFPDVMMIAEESTDYSNVTRKEGLGFDFNWNMGWMNDTLSYIATDPFFRKGVHNKMTFSFVYSFNERFLLPISHDEVVHGKKSLIDKMSGDYYQKFATARTYLGYMMTHPGKKLMFMGNEFAQFREWDFENSLEWFMLDYEMHAKFQRYVADLNMFYLENPCMWENDGNWTGFEWIDADRCEDNTYIYRRVGNDGDEVTFVLNFAPVQRRYDIPVKAYGWFKEVFNSDKDIYGGSGVCNDKSIRATKQGKNSYTIGVTVPPMGFVAIRNMKGMKAHD